MRVRYEPLPATQRPLVERFYRALRSPTRPRDASVWVARAPDPVAAVCLAPMAGGHWLSGLLVDPAWRGRGVGSGLLGEVRTALAGPIWLFCHPDLQRFYQPLGFAPEATPPAPLAERLARYRRHKSLMALVSPA